MAIYRCNKCGYLEEAGAERIGTTQACPKCGLANATYDTVFFVSKLLEKHFAALTTVKRLQAEAEEREAEAPPSGLQGVDLHNTDRISTDVQHGPVHDWFKGRNVRVEADPKAVDTTGFFDEVAVEIGADYELMKGIVDQIRHAYSRNYTNIAVNLSKRSQKEQQQLTTFCRQLYDYALVSKYFYQKTEKVIRLNLQSAARIRDFFNGEWLEWCALMAVLEVMQSAPGRSACARSLEVLFANEDRHELDVFALLGERPVCIECKSGEFRPYIEKYVTLRRRLGLTPQQFVVCVAGLPEEQAAGLSSMYELTFLNQQMLAAHLRGLVAQPA